MQEEGIQSRKACLLGQQKRRSDSWGKYMLFVGLVVVSSFLKNRVEQHSRKQRYIGLGLLVEVF